MAILIFKNSKGLCESFSTHNNNALGFELWRPSMKHIIPPLLSKKYLFWWFAHYFGIFKNKDYSAIITFDGNTFVGVIVLAPAYSRWKFMEKNDLQITNVHVDEKYRGQGIAYKMINIALERFSKEDRNFWYITTSDNIPSIKLCEKAGFQLAGKGEKTNRTGLKGFHEIKLTPEEKAHS